MDSESSLQVYRADMNRQLRHRLFFWVLGLRDQWKTHAAFRLPSPYPEYPLPLGFLRHPQCQFRETIEWIQEYEWVHAYDGRIQRDQVRHRYNFTFGFFGQMDDPERPMLWGIEENEWLARFQIPSAFYTDSAFDIHVQLVMVGILESLASGEPASIGGRIETAHVQGRDSAPYYFKVCEMMLGARAIQRVGARMVQRCQNPGCSDWIHYPGADVCDWHPTQPA
ncbi:hypothetical protein DFH07DRAFT_989252 [Mycena maculata]|uniref:Uncharacterized protein n=1 Tax=Mycena maculata TaxID=230809 RepID=A0AAD7I3Q3_9AGAR|nr:hypothetical protein DFH07DRAFT_989252 [Mycena maculata]